MSGQKLATKFLFIQTIAEHSLCLDSLLIDGDDYFSKGWSWKIVISKVDLAILRENGSNAMCVP